MKPILDDETKLLLSHGFLKGIDIIFLLLVLLPIAIGGALWWTTGLTLVVVLMAALTAAVSGLWCVVLAFRSVYFLFELKKDINGITEQSARKAVQFLQNLTKD